ncbi:MAG: hypothetical protein ACHQQQ_04285 [Bacteroidota bacterium]
MGAHTNEHGIYVPPQFSSQPDESHSGGEGAQGWSAWNFRIPIISFSFHFIVYFSPMPKIIRIVLPCTLVFILISIWCTLEPSHFNWGMHFLAFYSTPIQLCFLFLSLLILLPPVSTKAIQSLTSISQKLVGVPVKILFPLVSIILTVMWLSFPSKLHLLGDGAILLRSIPGVERLGGFPVSFRNQPLIWMLYLSGRAILRVFTSPTTVQVYYLVDIASGLGFVGLIFWWMKQIERPAIEKILLGAMVLFTGGFQFFFGYVENYVTQYVFTAAFAVTGWLALEKKIHILIPLCIYVLLVGLHLGSLIFIPAMLYMFVHRMGEHKLRAFLIIGAAGVVGIILVTLAGFNLWLFIQHFLRGSPDFLPVLPLESSFYPYSMFSIRHLIDCLNGQLLIVPMGLIIPAAYFVAYRKEIEWKNPALLFLIITTLCGFAFTWIINSALGFARDWDLFSSFYVPLIILNVYLLQLPFKMEGRRTIQFIAAVITILHIVPFIGINDNEDKHLARIEMLNAPQLLSVSTRMVYYEAMANFYFDHAGYDKAKNYYEQYIQFDSLNSRILANLADSYRKLEDNEGYFRVLERTVKLGNYNPGVFSNLGVEYARRGDTAKAIAMNLQCLSMDSLQVQALANLAILYLNTNQPLLALRYASGAITLGMSDPVMYRIKAKSYIKMNNYASALTEYDKYLKLVPGDNSIREQRARLATLLSKRK